MIDPNDRRAGQARDWALQQWPVSAAEFTVASADASFRRYFRLRSGPQSRIVMDAPPEHEDCRPFLRIARLLHGWGLNVPDIHAEDLQRGFLLLGDLGSQTYLDILSPATAGQRMGEALEALLDLQVAAQARPADWAFLPAYDADLLWRELRLFQQWYVPRHLGLELDAAQLRDLEQAQAPLVESALAQARTFVHRDFMPRNLMVGAAAPGILDFQDAVAGPISYDPICLFRDAFLSWPSAQVQEWLRLYWERARAKGLPVPEQYPEFRRQAEWMGVQRHLKVLGIFARLSYRDGKAKYVADTPRFVRYVMDVVPAYPELRGLADWFEAQVLPRVAL